MQRRHFLQRTIVGATTLAIGRSVVAAVSAADAHPSGPAPRLIVILLRGAVDGLSVVAPYADAAYYRERPDIALARPSGEGTLLDLDGHFGLHPALRSLAPYWTGQRLAFVHACGSPDETRSHFDAQDYLESGTPGVKRTSSGWMNRLIGAMHLPPSAAQAVAVGPVLPRIYAGAEPVINLASGQAAVRPSVLDRREVGAAFAALYAGNDSLAQAYRTGVSGHQAVMQDLQPDTAEMTAANNGAPLPNGFPGDAAALGTLMRRDSRVRLAFAALGGWDTHAQQGAEKGQLANRLAPLGEGLAVLADRLGPAFDETVVVVMSEFGRTVRQNGNRGTDHGHGNVMWLLGGPVAGGRIYGTWPGLEASALYQGRDLAVTTDFRTVLTSVLRPHLKLSDEALAVVFPGAPAASPLGLLRTA